MVPNLGLAEVAGAISRTWNDQTWAEAFATTWGRLPKVTVVAFSDPSPPRLPCDPPTCSLLRTIGITPHNETLSATHPILGFKSIWASQHTFSLAIHNR
jgi:hypothetical protein